MDDFFFSRVDRSLGRLFTALPDGNLDHSVGPGWDDLAVRDFAIIDDERPADPRRCGWTSFWFSIADPYASLEEIRVDISGSVERLSRGVDKSALLMVRARSHLRFDRD